MTTLKRIREDKGISQKQLAERSKVPLRMLQNYEQGVRDFDGASLERLCDVAIALEVNLWDILDSTELAEKVKKCTQ